MKKLTLGRKLAFASCDVLGGGAFNIINFLYPGFLALTVGLSAYWISAIVLVGRIWDAVIDPIIGQLSDGTRSRYGKRRIYMIVAAPLVLAALFLMFYRMLSSSRRGRRRHSCRTFVLRRTVVYYDSVLFALLRDIG
jgi:oligogalacturonide transporter